MYSLFHMVMDAHPIEVLNPAADAAGRTGAWIDMATCKKAFFHVHITQGNAATILLSLLQATSNAGAGSTAHTVAVPVYASLDTSLATGSDALAVQTAGVSFTTDAGVKNKIVVFEVDPVEMNIAGGFKFCSISTGASNVANITECTAYLVGLRYQQLTPLTALT